MMTLSELSDLSESQKIENGMFRVREGSTFWRLNGILPKGVPAKSLIAIEAKGLERECYELDIVALSDYKRYLLKRAYVTSAPCWLIEATIRNGGMMAIPAIDLELLPSAKPYELKPHRRGRKPLPTPEKACCTCGKTFNRRYNETLARYDRRRCCSRSCTQYNRHQTMPKESSAAASSHAEAEVIRSLMAHLRLRGGAMQVQGLVHALGFDMAAEKIPVRLLSVIKKLQLQNVVRVEMTIVEQTGKSKQSRSYWAEKPISVAPRRCDRIVLVQQEKAL